MVLDEYADQVEENSSSKQQATHINFKNPDHPEAGSGSYDVEDAREWFDAAIHVQNTDIDRTAIVGDFLSALQEADEADDNETLTQIFKIIRPEMFEEEAE